ncbi:rare lipoprotein A [Inhella inkyongensis]|uniref:Endolytic peptidoglycan transglycosylase RlpA n=1 Tax=Inhella inkyongensis TaxID=392593 RepID=A0A840SBB0_9BURK|nr:septal ring lytic transglycosylase RlpA family protein [Inhella inkyongensis]MBB5205639.1 rare lipoprotein A [Inhella inkyongensis]
MRCLALLALLLLALLQGCATRSPSPGSERDGPEASPPRYLDQVPDAVPRVEPIRLGGPNKPYEVLGERYVPLLEDLPYEEQGLASWYGKKFHGRRTASGETYNMYAMSAAHPRWPLPSYARVRNPANGREVIVRVNDRGPFHRGRVIDLSYTAALKLDLLRGVAPVEIRRLSFDEIRAGRWSRPETDPVLAAPADAAAAPPAPTTEDLRDPESKPLAEAAPEVRAASRGLWLQLGAFRQLEGVLALKEKIQTRWPELAPLLTSYRDRGLNRLQLGPFETREQAEAQAQALREAGYSPLLVRRP